MTVKEHAQNSRGRGRHMKRAANQDARVLVQELTLLYKGPRGTVTSGFFALLNPQRVANQSSPDPGAVYGPRYISEEYRVKRTDATR